MKKSVVLIALLYTTMGAKNIEQFIAQAIKKHPSLRAINHQLSAMDAKIKLSTKYSNPNLSYTINDIQFSKPLDRALEPMQFQAIQLQQSIIWGDKLEAKEDLEQSRKVVLSHTYEEAKVTLAKEVRMSVYIILEMQEHLKIIKKYLSLMKQNIELYTNYTSTEDNAHINSVNAKLLFSKMQIIQQKYQAILKENNAKLSYLIQGEVKKVSSLHYQMKKSKPLRYYLSKIGHNPLYHKKQTIIQSAKISHHLASLNKTPNPYLKMGYYQRDNLNDYASFSFGISLPIYDKEALNIEISKKRVLETSSEIIDFTSLLKSQIQTAHIKMNEAYKIYAILKNETLPELKHMFELMESHIQNGGTLFKYINLLEQKLALEQEQVTIKSFYFQQKAQIKFLIGEI